MKRIIYSIACLAVCILLLLETGVVMAAEGTVTYGSSSYSATEGKEFQVGVYVNGSEAIGAYDFYLDYNADMLEYVSGADSGGGGRLKFSGFGNAASYNYMLTFRALKAGSLNITINNVYLGPLDPNSGDSMTVTAAASAPVSIQGPSTASGECRLSELSISPTGLWGFSPDKTEYDITVDNDISKLAITAKAESEKASVVISDTNLAEGVNTITIKVTAENGTVKNYSIIVRRKPKPAENQTQTATTVSDPNIDNLSISFLVNGRDMYITENVDGIDAPDGFQKTAVTYKGQEIPAFTSLTQNITLFYLQDGLKEEGAFYAYNSEQDSVYPYIRLTNTSGSYMIISPGADVKAPEGYSETTLSLSNGGDQNVSTAIQAWILGSNTEYFLIYALNDQGECAFYQYDTKEKTLQRYNESIVPAQPSQPETTEPAPEDADKIEKLEQEVIRLKMDNQIDAKNKLLIIIALAVFCVVLIIAVIGLIFKLKGQADDGMELDDSDDLDGGKLEEEYEFQYAKAMSEQPRENRETKTISREEAYAAESTAEYASEAAAAAEPQRDGRLTAEPERQRKREAEPEQAEENEEDDGDFLMDLDDDDFTFFDYDDK